MLLGLALLALSAPAVTPFRDAATCRAALTRGEHFERAAPTVRVVTWNVRWFPDGGPGKTARTNLEWLACVMAWLDADVFVLEEIKRSASASAAMVSVIDQLREQTHAGWTIVADECPHPESQHLAMLYRSDRVALTHVTTRGVIDPTVAKGGTPACPGRLRPALTAYVTSRRGGLDFHVAGVHLDSGQEERDQRDRIEAWQRLPALTEAMQTAVADDDVIVLGDFNTMGCKGCGLSSAPAELEAMITALRKLAFPFRVASTELGCSEYYRERGNLLDHVLIAATMQEADDAPIQVSGICAALACKKLDAAHLPAMTELSDHCPVIVDIPDRDIDGR